MAFMVYCSQRRDCACGGSVFGAQARQSCSGCAIRAGGCGSGKVVVPAPEQYPTACRGEDRYSPLPTTVSDTSISIVKLYIWYPYLPQASINACYNRGCAKNGFKSEVLAWKTGLTLVVKNALQELPRDVLPPINLKFRLFRPSTTRVVDAGNFSKIIEDAVIEAFSFDDNDLRLIRGPYSGAKSSDKRGWFVIIIEEVGSLDEVYTEDEHARFALRLEEPTFFTSD
jgi:hypothetical protein